MATLNYFILLNYIKDEDLYKLYENCLGIIVPTLVAPHTFPLYEAFYFKKPVIYNINVLDKNLKDKVITLDVNDKYDFKNALKKINNKNEIQKLILSNHKYFKELFDDKKIIFKLNEILKKN